MGQSIVIASILTLIASLAPPASADSTVTCDAKGVSVQILGSGGPIPDDARASAGYLVWVDGKARVLVDAGAGVFQRFGASGAKLEDLQHFAVTHFHADHASDIAALVFGTYFSPRTKPLTISGPMQGGDFPSLQQYLTREFSSSNGVYGYLSGALDGTRGMVKLIPIEVDQRDKQAVIVAQTDDLIVRAVGVDHGPVPAVGYLVEVQGYRLAFSGDQNGSRDPFWKMIEDADILFMDTAVAEDAGRIARNLHAIPSAIGKRSKQSKIKHLVLSHLMARSLKTMAENISIIRQDYTGPLDVGDDLACYKLPAIH